MNPAALVSITSGTMEGTGSIGAADVDDGTFEPGDSAGSTEAGTFTASGNVSLSSNSKFSIRLGISTGAASDVDGLDMTGGVFSIVDGTTLLEINDTAIENSAIVGTVYVLVDGGAGATGTDGDAFANAPATGDVIQTAVHATYEVLYATDAAGDGQGTGNDIAVKVVVTPEPGTWASVLGGMGVLLMWEWARRRPG